MPYIKRLSVCLDEILQSNHLGNSGFIVPAGRLILQITRIYTVYYDNRALAAQ